MYDYKCSGDTNLYRVCLHLKLNHLFTCEVVSIEMLDLQKNGQGHEVDRASFTSSLIVSWLGNFYDLHFNEKNCRSDRVSEFYSVNIL